jgi:hypothetical protein
MNLISLRPPSGLRSGFRIYRALPTQRFQPIPVFHENIAIVGGSLALSLLALALIRSTQDRRRKCGRLRERIIGS